MRVLTERTGDISIVDGGEEVTIWGETDRRDGVQKKELLGEGVCLGSQSSMGSVERGRVVHLGVATLEGRVFREEDHEVKVAVDVREGEFMMFDKWKCEWERTRGRRQRDGVFYSPPRWTLCVSTPARLSKSLLWPSILSIRSRTCMPMECLSGIRSSQSHILLLPLLNWEAELGSSSCGPHFLSKV